MELDSSERKQLRQFLVRRFNLNELKTLAFDIGADYQLFQHEEKGIFSVELITFCERNNRLNLLVTESLKKWRDDDLVQLLAKLPQLDEPPIKVQIIVSEEKLDDLLEFLDEFAERLNCKRDEITLISAAWGSVRLLVSLPPHLTIESSTLNFTNSKYQFISIVHFSSMDKIEQETWLYIASNHPLRQQGDFLQPTTFWSKVLKTEPDILFEITSDLKASKFADEVSDGNDLAIHLEQTLQRSEIKDPQLVQTISALLHRSVEYGRAARVLGETPGDEACREHVNHVIGYYRQYHTLIAGLERGDAEVWTDTLKKIQAWTNGYLIKHNIHGELKKKSLEECVPNAILAYLSGTYFFDTDFDAWFCVLVHNVCRKYIKEQLRPDRIQPKEILSYDKFELLLEALADNSQVDSQQIQELRAVLLGAIEKLSSDARKELILRHYFYDYSFKEIAEALAKSLNAIYKLHFDALNELREHLEDWE